MAKRRTRIELADFEAKIIQLRRNGVPYEKIAQSTGDSVSNVIRAYKRACNRLPTNDLAQMRQIQDAQLEEIFQRAMALAQKGSVPALAEARKALRDRAELFGLNAPVTTKSEITGKDGGPIRTEQGLTAQDIEEMTDAERATIRRIAERKVKRNATCH